MSTIAFSLIAVMIAAYAMLDGYDLGVGAIMPFIARDERERGAVMAAIGPFWNGNEVWLVAAGGTLFALFPRAYASAFSGFYLPFMVVLWLLMFRGISIELRNHKTNPLWRAFFDASFSVSSALLIVLFGIAVANLLRGVPLDEHAYFRGTFAFLLNPYALGIGLFALIVLSLHGAIFLATRTEDAVGERALRVARTWWPIAALAYGAATIATVIIHPLWSNFTAAPVLIAIPLVTFAGFAGTRIFTGFGRPHAAFAASSVFIGGLLLSAAVTLFPYLLTGYPDPATGLTVGSAAPPSSALAVGSTVAIVGLAIVAVYTWVARRNMRSARSRASA